MTATHKGREVPAFQGDVTIPDASKYTILLDSTDPAGGEYKNVKAAALSTPGGALGTVSNKIYDMLWKCTGQNVTVLCLYLDPFGEWELTADGSTTVVAGAGSAPIRFYARGAAGVAIAVLAGATPPTTLGATVIESEQS